MKEYSVSKLKSELRSEFRSTVFFLELDTKSNTEEFRLVWILLPVSPFPKINGRNGFIGLLPSSRVRQGTLCD